MKMKKLFSLHLIFLLFVSCSNKKKDKKNLATFAVLSHFSDTTNKSSSKENKPPPVIKLNIQDPLYKDQWYLKNTGQNSGTVGIDINVEPVWKQGYTGKGMHIAILDEPIGLTDSETHEDLARAKNLRKSHNYLPFSQINHPNHGLEVAGVIAARSNNLGIRGIAYESTLYTYGVYLDQLVIANVIDAMNRVNQIPEITVVNNSWGNELEIIINEQYQTTLEQGLQTGFNGKGIVQVRAAGNNGMNVNSTLEGNNNYYGAVIVNSLDNNGSNTEKKFENGLLSIAFRTSIGSNLWISAPGDKITTTSSAIENPKYIHLFGATSAAAPIVTGVVALMRQANSNLTWRDVKLILAESAVKNDPSHSGWKQGYSKKNKPTESFHFNHNYGFGMVNAKESIKLSKIWNNLPTMKTKTFSSAILDLAIDANIKKNTITVQNSDINFIESVVVDLEVEKRVNIENTEKFELQLEHNGIVSHFYMEGKAFSFAEREYDSNDKPTIIVPNDYYDKNQMILKMLTNAHLGGSANGTWKIKIKDTEVFTKLKKWKLIIRGH